MIEQTALHDRIRIIKIDTLMKEIGKEIQAKLPKIYSKDLIQVLFKLPYTKRILLEEAGLGNKKTVGNYLKQLQEKGFLISEQVGKEKLYLNYRLLKILIK